MKKTVENTITSSEIARSEGFDSALMVGQITRNLQELLKLAPYVVLPEVGHICDGVEANFIKTLLISYLYQEISQQIAKHTSLKIEKLEKPFIFQENVRFTIYTSKSKPLFKSPEQYFRKQKKFFKAKKVLVKEAVGKKIGLVISNDYFGLLLDLNSKTPIANRFWQQKELKLSEHAFPLWFSESEREKLEKHVLQHLSKTIPSEILERHMRENVQLQNTLSYLLNTLALLQIEIDPQRINYSQSMSSPQNINFIF